LIDRRARNHFIFHEYIIDRFLFALKNRKEVGSEFDREKESKIIIFPNFNNRERIVSFIKLYERNDFELSLRRKFVPIY